jgi:hypothetical protein
VNETKGENDMPTTMTIKEAVARRNAARDEYGAAVKRFRSAYVTLAALEVLLTNRGIDGNRGFGPPPDMIPLRHSVVHADVPGVSIHSDVAGTIGADINAIVHSTTIE